MVSLVPFFLIKKGRKNQDERRLVRSNKRSIALCARSTKFPSGLGIHALYEKNESFLRPQTSALIITDDELVMPL